MNILFFALSFFGLITAIATVSLVESSIKAIVFSVAQALPVVIALPIVMHTPLPALLAIPRNPGILTNLALVVLIENLLSLFMTLAALRVHAGLDRVRAGFAFYLPSLSAAGGMVLVMAAGMNKSTGLSYPLLGFLTFAGFAAVVFVMGRLARIGIKVWNARLELKALLSFLAVLICSTIPLLGKPVHIAGTPVHISLIDLCILAIVLISGITLGVALHCVRGILRKKA
jgi:hypothetical protein